MVLTMVHEAASDRSLHVSMGGGNRCKQIRYRTNKYYSDVAASVERRSSQEDRGLD